MVANEVDCRNPHSAANSTVFLERGKGRDDGKNRH